MNLQYLYVSIGVVRPKLDRMPTKDVNVYQAPGRIHFLVIRIPARIGLDFLEMTNQGLLFRPLQLLKVMENLDIKQESKDNRTPYRPSFCSASSSEIQFSGFLSSTFPAIRAACPSRSASSSETSSAINRRRAAPFSVLISSVNASRFIVRIINGPSHSARLVKPANNN